MLGLNADTSTNGGVTLDYSYGPFDVRLGNGSDTLTLLDPSGNVLDIVSWDDGFTFPDPTGASI